MTHLAGRSPRSLQSIRGHRLAAIVAIAILVMTAASGCLSSMDGRPPCMPPAYSVDPSTASPGETVTVTAPNAGCDPRYGENALIRVVVTDSAKVELLDATAEMNDAGGFTFAFEVPSSAAAGEGFVTATPYAVDWCDDTGRNNRADRAVPTWQLASCAVPIKPLTITP